MQSPRSDANITSSEHTATLANPVGGATSDVQMRGISRSEADINNINDSTEKSKGKNNFFSGNYSPAPIPPKELGRLLARLEKTGLAKDVITDAEALRGRTTAPHWSEGETSPLI
jgi:hypothetical protein